MEGSEDAESEVDEKVGAGGRRAGGSGSEPFEKPSLMEELDAPIGVRGSKGRRGGPHHPIPVPAAQRVSSLSAICDL